jgi:hypothetical protein
MALELLKDYVVYYDAGFYDKRHPTSLFKAHILATKKYVFIFPQESHGEYFFFHVKSTYDIFEGTPVKEMLEKLVSKATTTEDLENTVKKLLNESEQYVHLLSDKRICNFRSFLGKHTLTMSYGTNKHVGVMVNGNGTGKQFRNFLNM